MDRNIRIARELVRMARSLVAAFGSDLHSSSEYKIKDLGGGRVLVTLKNKLCSGIWCHLIENGVPKSLDEFYIEFDWITHNGKEYFNELLESALSGNNTIHDSFVHDVMLSRIRKRQDHMSSGQLEQVKREYEENPEKAYELYDYRTFDAYYAFEYDLKGSFFNNRIVQRIGRKVFDIVSEGGSVDGFYEFRHGLFTHSSFGASAADTERWKAEFMMAYDANQMKLYMPPEEAEALFSAGNQGGKTMIGGFDVTHLKTLSSQEEYDKVCEPAISAAVRLLDQAGMQFLEYGEIRMGNDIEGCGMNYIDKIDLIEKNSAKLSAKSMESSLIHELGHRYDEKFMDDRQKSEMRRAYESRKRRFSELKKGDVIEFENGKVFTVKELGRYNILLKSDDGSEIKNEDISLIVDRIRSINGVGFLYEADGIPSNYSLRNEHEFIADCFRAWVYGEFSGDLKEFFDGVFKRH